MNAAASKAGPLLAANAGPSLADKTTTAVKNIGAKATAFANSLQNQIAGTPVPAIGVILLVGIVLFIVFYVIPVLIMESRRFVSNPNNIATIRSEQLTIFEGQMSKEFKDKGSLAQAIQAQQVTANENCLMNFQPLTVIHPGFLGPLKNGVYDNENIAVSTILRMGCRCIVLPIDYHDKDTMAKPFPEPNKPCLLYRDEGGTVRSINAGEIRVVAQTIADFAWSDAVQQKNDPFILVLYFNRTPEPGTRAYLDFLSKVAVDLNPLSQYLLGQTPEGVYNRQGRQEQLLFVDTNQFEKKLIVMCNVDTKGFQTSKQDFNHTYLTKEDLDYWVHMRIYKQNLDTNVGMTTIPEKNVLPRAMIDRTTYYTTLPTDQTTKNTAVAGTKEKFMITLSLQGQNPSSEVLTLLLDTYGVQSVPFLLIDYSPDVQRNLSQWKYAWRAKPKAIRYVRPDPLQTTPQSPAANANGGALTSPT
jgi:hypothetical protein